MFGLARGTQIRISFSQQHPNLIAPLSIHRKCVILFTDAFATCCDFNAKAFVSIPTCLKAITWLMVQSLMSPSDLHGYIRGSALQLQGGFLLSNNRLTISHKSYNKSNKNGSITTNNIKNRNNWQLSLLQHTIHSQWHVGETTFHKKMNRNFHISFTSFEWLLISYFLKKILNLK